MNRIRIIINRVKVSVFWWNPPPPNHLNIGIGLVPHFPPKGDYPYFPKTYFFHEKYY